MEDELSQWAGGTKESMVSWHRDTDFADGPRAGAMPSSCKSSCVSDPVGALSFLLLIGTSPSESLEFDIDALAVLPLGGGPDGGGKGDPDTSENNSSQLKLDCDASSALAVLPLGAGTDWAGKGDEAKELLHADAYCANVVEFKTTGGQTSFSNAAYTI